jgi:hypothetical protein
MDDAIELLERHGLVRDEDSLRVMEFGKRKIARLHRELYSTILDKQEKDFEIENEEEIDPFSFVASRSLRAGLDQSGIGSSSPHENLVGTQSE